MPRIMVTWGNTRVIDRQEWISCRFFSPCMLVLSDISLIIKEEDRDETVNDDTGSMPACAAGL